MRLYVAIIISVAGAAIFAGCRGGSGNSGGDKHATAERAFKRPEVPAMLASPEERAGYLARHYWDLYDFADTALLNNGAITEQAFTNYLQALSVASAKDVTAGVKATLDKASAGDSTAIGRFAALFEKYLHDPNSPIRNEELYIPVLRYMIASDKVPELEKIRPRMLLEMALKNRPGDVATDFAYTLSNGRQGRLWEIKNRYTLLFFNNPDCHDCARVKEFIELSPYIGDNPNVSILALYPDEDLTLWRAISYPKGWINACDNGVVKRDRLYDLKAIPCLYLLDSDKRVILKDATIERIEEYLRSSGETK